MFSNLLSYIGEATLIGKAVLVLLLTMSIWSWAIILYKWIFFQKIEKKIRNGITSFQEQSTLNDALQIIGEDPKSPLCYISEQAILEVSRLKKTSCSANTAITTLTRTLNAAVKTQNSEIRFCVPFLATIANASPFLGLFGTVWGIINTFTVIGSMKTASFTVVAPSLAEALFVTAVGIFVAIPASIAFNSFQNRVSKVSLLLSNYADILLNCIQRELTAAQVSSQARQNTTSNTPINKTTTGTVAG
ncbi:MAG: MotA/TolQ/ExbB proton channel family protein [Desulfovibrionaceae bacterium]